MYKTHSKGEEAVLKIQLKALAKDVLISKPCVECRYDLVLDDQGKLFRVQVKYTSQKQGEAICLDLRKQTRNNGEYKVYTKDEIDLLLVYVAGKDIILRLPPELFHGKSHLSFREVKPKNNQQKSIHYLEDYVW